MRENIEIIYLRKFVLVIGSKFFLYFSYGYVIINWFIKFFNWFLVNFKFLWIGVELYIIVFCL